MRKYEKFEYEPSYEENGQKKRIITISIILFVILLAIVLILVFALLLAGGIILGVFLIRKGNEDGKKEKGDVVYESQTEYLVEDTETIFFSNTGKGLIAGWCTSAYEFGVIDGTLYWGDIETSEGVYVLTDINTYFSQAKACKKVVGFRIGPFNDGSKHLPGWLITKMAGDGVTDSNGVFIPNHNSAIYKDAVSNFIERLALEYKDNKRLMWIEVSFWGEWHLASDVGGLTPQEINDNFITRENAKWLIDKFYLEFPNVQKIQLTDHIVDLEYSVAKGSGMRSDCLGDWNYHMTDNYPPRVAVFGQNWTRAPSLWETCYGLGNWESNDVNFTLTFETALDWHATTLATWEQMPSQQKNIDLTYDFVKKMGYRFVLDDITVKILELKNNFQLNLKSTWRNVGVAPIYLDVVLRWNVTFETNENKTIPFISTNAVRLWLPGITSLDEDFDFSKDNLNLGEETKVRVKVCMYMNIDVDEDYVFQIAIQKDFVEGCYLVFEDTINSK